jgi:hypothetical protein
LKLFLLICVIFAEESQNLSQCDPGTPSVSSTSRLHQTRAAQPFRRVICAPTE